MVNTRSQRAKIIPAATKTMDRDLDTESEDSVLEVLTTEQIIEFNNGDLINNRNNSEMDTFN